MARILIVDDEYAIRSLLVEFLSSLGHEVIAAQDGLEALDILSRASFQLVLSDINMPRMKGFDLLAEVRKQYPATKRALITAYDVEDYLEMALSNDIGNIIPKTAPFNFQDVETVINHLLTENFFGLEQYLNPNATVHTAKVYTADQIHELADKISADYPTQKMQTRMKLVAVELITNAIFYGARKEGGDNKENWERDFHLAEKDAVEIQWANDGEKFAFSVADPFGRLTKNDVLHWLVRQTKKDQEGLPIGIYDNHGRGLFVARSYVDRMAINIKSNVRTEIIIMNYLSPKYGEFKPLYINEI